ncbi:MliC family protein [Agrilutibacter solisilvae]|uniref:MliC family protein n=1 Tax=Agrilutibacter solisilvae TaxID=2763317 RepID=A0A974XYJ0_9GAMM|nr:MliC family protein [Lysobacter solisilvae]QSX78147.1 MliC family protein [Lysobacter solisilvae]
MNATRLLPVALVLSLLACKPAGPGDAAQPSATPGAPTAGTPSSAEPAQARLPAPPIEHWQCGDQRIATRFEGAALDAMSLMFSGRRLPLRAATATEGARFADAAGNEFWSRPGKVTLTLAGKPATSCTKTDTASPWVDATVRGMAWRVAGSEPGWFAEVSDSDTPAIKATVDNGNRSYAVARAQRLPADEITWSGAADNGAALTLMIERSSCTDPMSGEEFEATGTLTVSGQTWRGCAASLKD